MARKTERQTLLERGEAQGKLRPEHKAELAAMRATIGAPEAKASDKKALQEASERSDAARRSLRLYDSVQPAIDRFDGGPTKGTFFDAIMPNEGGGIADSIGAFAGAPIRALVPQQQIDDYQAINSARAERIGLRSMEQKGVMAKNDEIQFKAADISPSKTREANRGVLARSRTESILTKQRSYLESKWVSKYGSTANASPNGTTFEQALQEAQDNFSRSRQAPPSTRKAADSGWSVTEVK